MANNTHVNLPDGQLHNPKGFVGASNNTYLTKDNLGSLSWVANGAGTLFDLTLNQSNLQSLVTTPYELVAAPGSKKGVICLWALGYYTYNSVAFSGNTDLRILCDTATVWQLESANNIAGGANTVIRFNPMFDQNIDVQEVLDNKALQITNPTADLTGGGASSSLRIYGGYVIVSLP